MKTRSTLVAPVALLTLLAPALAQKKKAAPTPPPGGANQVQGLEGKLGDTLFDGRWRFQVQSVREVPTYAMAFPSSQQDYGIYAPYAQFAQEGATFTPKAGYTLLAVTCRVKNGQKTPQHLDCYPTPYKKLQTALADTDENSYPPIVYDMQTDGAWTTRSLLPGSGQTMTILFAVPPGTKPKDLVFSLKNYDDKKVTHLRISLAQRS